MGVAYSTILMKREALYHGAFKMSIQSAPASYGSFGAAAALYEMSIGKKSRNKHADVLHKAAASNSLKRNTKIWIKTVNFLWRRLLKIPARVTIIDRAGSTGKPVFIWSFINVVALFSDVQLYTQKPHMQGKIQYRINESVNRQSFYGWSFSDAALFYWPFYIRNAIRIIPCHHRATQHSSCNK